MGQATLYSWWKQFIRFCEIEAKSVKSIISGQCGQWQSRTGAIITVIDDGTRRQIWAQNILVNRNLSSSWLSISTPSLIIFINWGSILIVIWIFFFCPSHPHKSSETIEINNHHHDKSHHHGHCHQILSLLGACGVGGDGGGGLRWCKAARHCLRSHRVVSL